MNENKGSSLLKVKTWKHLCRCMKCKIHFNLLGQNEQYSPFSEGNKVTTGSEDFIDTEPQDADNRKSVLTSVAGYIIVTEFCERLAYYGFAGSLVLFLQVITKSLTKCVYTIPNIHTYICMYICRESSTTQTRTPTCSTRCGLGSVTWLLWSVDTSQTLIWADTRPS
jgi:hypothetical protein